MSRPNKAFGQVAKQQDYAVEIDDTDSPYTTNGETQIYVDTSTAAVTVQLATADLAVGKSIDIYDDGNNAATNNITITTEGSATFVPGGVASLTIDTDGAYRQVRGGSTNWFADLKAQRSAVATDELNSAKQTPSDVSGSRSLDTEEQNTSGRLRSVSVTLRSDGAQDIFCEFRAGDTSGNTQNMDRVRIQSDSMSSDTRFSVGGIVPDGHYYQVATFTGHSATVQSWDEADWA